MSKQCDVCNTINYDAANHCSHCGYEFPDKELTEEDKLRNELFQAKETIQGLNRAIAEMQKKEYNFEEVQKATLDYKRQLDKEKKESETHLKLSIEKDRKINYIKKQLKTTKRIRTVGIVFFLIFSAVLSIIAVKTKQENKVIQEKIRIFSECFPLIIKSLKIGNAYSNGNIETGFGKKLYSRNSMYLKPQIEYVGFKKTNITLSLKLYRNGVLTYGKSSPEGFSYNSVITTSDKGVCLLDGWGNGVKGNWPGGNYRYEIWYNDMCLKAENFTLY